MWLPTLNRESPVLTLVFCWWFFMSTLLQLSRNHHSNPKYITRRMLMWATQGSGVRSNIASVIWGWFSLLMCKTGERARVVRYCCFCAQLWLFASAGYSGGENCREEVGRRGQVRWRFFGKLSCGPSFPLFIESTPVCIDKVLWCVMRWAGGVVHLTVRVPSRNISEAGIGANVSSYFVDIVAVVIPISNFVGFSVQARLLLAAILLRVGWVIISIAPWNGDNGGPVDGDFVFRCVL